MAAGMAAGIAVDFMPYYEGFNGTISKIGESKYLIKGKYEKMSVDKYRITELPVGVWTDDFKEHLESLTETTDKAGKKIAPVVKDYDDMSKDTNVDFIITLTKGLGEELENTILDNGCNGFEKMFKLMTTNTTTNMHLFDADDKLKKYTSVCEIIDDYYVSRLELYKVRKDAMIVVLENELILLSNKVKYIKEVLDGSIDLRRKKREEVSQMLLSKGYDIIDDDADFKYLTKLPMDSVAEENVERLEKEHGAKTNELALLKTTTIQQLWLGELTALETEYLNYKEARERIMTGEKKKGGGSAKIVKKVTKVTK